MFGGSDPAVRRGAGAGDCGWGDRVPRRAARPYTTYSLTPPQTEGPTRTIRPPAARDTDEGSVDRDALRRPRVGVGEGPTSCRSIHSAGGRSLCVTPEGGSTCLGTTEPSPLALGPAPENGTGVTCTPVCRLCLKCSSDLHDAGAAIAGLRAHGPTRTRSRKHKQPQPDALLPCAGARTPGPGPQPCGCSEAASVTLEAQSDSLTRLRAASSRVEPRT